MMPFTGLKINSRMGETATLCLKIDEKRSSNRKQARACRAVSTDPGVYKWSRVEPHLKHVSVFLIPEC